MSDKPLSFMEKLLQTAEVAAHLRRAQVAAPVASSPVPLATIMVTPPPIQPSVVANVQPAPIAPPDADLSIPLSNSPAAPPASAATPQGEKDIPMTEVSTDVTAIATGAANTVISTVESAAGSVISKIASGALTLWTDVESSIDADVAKISKALPASAQTSLAATVTAVKQGASDAISFATTAGSAILPALAKDGEAILDQALATYSNGAALPLVPLVNAGIDDIVAMAVAAAQAWGLKAKATLVTPA